MNKVLLLNLIGYDDSGESKDYSGFWLNGEFIGGGCYEEGADPDLISHMAHNVAWTITETGVTGCEFQICEDNVPDYDWEWGDFGEQLPLTETTK